MSTFHPRVPAHAVQALVGVPVVYRAGWNLVGAPDGTVFNSPGNAYTFGPGDVNYHASPPATPVRGGTGYWVFLPADTTVMLNGIGLVTMQVQAPAGQYFMIGNPDGVQAVRVSGADQVLTYDPTSGRYSSVTALLVGQGAWAFSNGGGPVTLTGIGAPLPLPSATPGVATPAPQPSPSPLASGPPLTVGVSIDQSRSTLSGGQPGTLVLDIDVTSDGRPATDVTVSGGISFYGGSAVASPDITFGPDFLGNYTGEALDLAVPALTSGTPVLIHVDASLNGVSASADLTYLTH